MAKDQMLGASKKPSTVVSVEPSANAKLTGVPDRRSARPASSIAASFGIQSATRLRANAASGVHGVAGLQKQPVHDALHHLNSGMHGVGRRAPVWTHSTATMIVHVAVMSTAAALRWRSWCIVGICDSASCMVPYASSHQAMGTLPLG